MNIATFGHTGDGYLHPTATTDARDHEEVNRVEQAFAENFEAAFYAIIRDGIYLPSASSKGVVESLGTFYRARGKAIAKVVMVRCSLNMTIFTQHEKSTVSEQSCLLQE